jgi:transposase-like protein
MLKKKIFVHCPYCGSTNLKRDLPKSWKINHKQCLDCKKHWQVILDKVNDFGIG